MSGLVLDDKWDSTVEEFGAINMTGLRIVQYGTNLARDFFVHDSCAANLSRDVFVLNCDSDVFVWKAI